MDLVFCEACGGKTTVLFCVVWKNLAWCYAGLLKK